MKRQIHVKGRNRDTGEVRAKLREAVQRRFNVSTADANIFVKDLMDQWDDTDIDSVLKQAHNKDRPAVVVNVTGHDPVFANVLANLVSVTDGQDTAQDPNIAIRHPGHAEIMLRRLRYGDLLAMQIMHHMEEKASNKNITLSDYFGEFLHTLVSKIVSQNNLMVWEGLEPIQQLSLVSDFCRTYCKYDVKSAFTKTSQEFCGIEAHTFGGNVHSTRMRLNNKEDDGDILAAAVSLMVKGLNYYNMVFLLDMLGSKVPIPEFETYFVDRATGNVAKGVIVNGDHATEEPAEILRDTGMGIAWKRPSPDASGSAPVDTPVDRGEPEPHEERDRESPRSNILHGDSQNIGDAFRRVISRALGRNEDEHVGGTSESASSIFEEEIRTPTGQSESESDTVSRRGRELLNTRYCGWYCPPLIRGTNIPNLSQDYPTYRPAPRNV